MRRFLAAVREIGRMRRLWLLAIAFIVAGLACAASAAALANILIQIDKPSQTMTVSINGQLLAGRSRPELPASRLLMAPTRPSAWRSCTTRRNGTMPECHMRSSSPRGATASMAQTIQASARPSPTVNALSYSLSGLLRRSASPNSRPKRHPI